MLRATREDEEQGVVLRKWLAVQPGQAMCDLGCGNGYHTLPLAEAVGPAGKVFAVELQAQMLVLLRQRSEKQHLANITFVGQRRSMNRSSDCGKCFGAYADVIMYRFGYFAMRRMASSHQGSAPLAMITVSSGKKRQTSSRAIGCWHFPGSNGPGIPVLIEIGNRRSTHLA